MLWTMNKTSFHTQWDYPTLMYVAEHNTSWAATQNILRLPLANEWVYIAVQSPFAQDHPMHLHGHDFWVLGSGFGTIDTGRPLDLQLVNAPRRDVAMMPASGYLVIAIKTNIPGAWLMHCHIAWHTSEGFAVQLLEREDEIRYDYDTLNATCTNWKHYCNALDVEQHDSGVQTEFVGTYWVLAA